MKPAATVNLDPVRIRKAVDILKSVAHPARLAVIELLSDNEEMSVGAIQSYLKIEQSLLSHHLMILRENGIVACRRDGKSIRYRLAERNLLRVLECISSCCAQ
ncbi:MAG: metalloregulator ArsR/SmtB family transcription factor [Bacteroidia bacterium]|nr:metalloregulator ArsR/SmtB family transcription factor [Bacteroidia bacterium]MDW8332848.1 metalloregulator ArsR/SmtB family transcription factor [Bacteroidia bacterium]